MSLCFAPQQTSLLINRSVLFVTIKTLMQRLNFTVLLNPAYKGRSLYLTLIDSCQYRLFLSITTLTGA
jgi:hypothetical protein